MARIWAFIKFFMGLAQWIGSIGAIFLPVIMKWTSVYFFDLPFKEYLSLAKSHDLMVIFTVIVISALAMLIAMYSGSLVGVLSGVVSIIVSHIIYADTLITIILSAGLVLGLVFQTLTNVLSADGLGVLITAKGIFGFLTILYGYGAYEMPAEFPIGLRVIFIIGAILSFLTLMTSSRDEDAMKIKEIQLAAGLIRAINWDKATDYGRHAPDMDLSDPYLDAVESTANSELGSILGGKDKKENANNDTNNNAQ